MTRRKNERRTVPHVPTNITREELEALRPPPARGLKTSGSGYLFVYARNSKPDHGNKCSEVCRTYRVRFKKENLPDGRPYYEDFSAGWTNARDAAKFVAGQFRVRYGPDWPALFRANQAMKSNHRSLSGRPHDVRVWRCPYSPGKWRAEVRLAGVWHRVMRAGSADGSFVSEKHAHWYLKAWANARFPTRGLSIVGFDPMPADARTVEEAHALLPETPARWRYWQRTFFDEPEPQEVSERLPQVW